MNDDASVLSVGLPQELQGIVASQLASGRYEAPVDVLGAALRLLDIASLPSGEMAIELSELRNLHGLLAAAKAERDFVIALTARQRRIPHAEAILQTTADLLGGKLGADRVGFYRIIGDQMEFGACWTNRRIAILRGRMPIASLGPGYEEISRSGQLIRTPNCMSDPALNGPVFTRMNAVAMLSVPLVRDMVWTAGLYVHQAEPRRWNAGETSLVSEVAELTWDAVERSNALRLLNDRVLQQDNDLSRAALDLRSETVGRITAEGQVRQLQKMEAVGQLTGGIAHDFNNMLAVIIGSLNLLQRRLARGDTNIARFVEAALEGATRAATLTHRLLAFSRQQPLTPEPIDANRMIAGMADMLNRTLGDAVEIETVLAAGLWATWVDVSQLENALLNLSVNARDAMPDGGKLTVETSNVHVDSGYARENEVSEGQYVLLAVTDTGTGMPADIAAKVFEPFFTTKDVGKGTGLGLSQVFGFVRQSGGAIKVYSEVGVGTNVKLYLPRFYGEIEPAAARRAHQAYAQIPGGMPHEIILVVEDEERVRNYSVEGLRELGYTVVHVASGGAALRLMQAGQDVTLLFTDIVMAGMTGRQLADKAKEMRGGIKVLYTTGFTRNAVVHNGVLDPGTNFLPKPFGLDQLALAVRRALDGAGA